MNSIRPFLQKLGLGLGLGANSTCIKRMSYIGHLKPNIRYGCVKIVDYTGYTYIIPYTCNAYTEEIDGFLLTIVCDIPPQDYHASSHIVETMVNQQLVRELGRSYDVKLMPPAKNMLPPCMPIA